MKDLFAEALNNAATDSITETERNIVGQAGTHHKEIGGHTYMVVRRSFSVKETVFLDTSKNKFLSIFVQRLRSKPWTYKSKFCLFFFLFFCFSFCIRFSRLPIG